MVQGIIIIIKVLYTMSSPIVKLNVGGIFFDTIEETLQDSDFFKGLLRNKNTMMKGAESPDERYFIDRSGMTFEHVLNLLRSPNYFYPEEYLQELDFYLIPSPQNVQLSNNTIMQEVLKMKKRMDRARKCKYEGCKLLPVENYPYCKRHGYFFGYGEEGKNIEVGSVILKYKDSPLVVENIFDTPKGKKLKVSNLYGDLFLVMSSSEKGDKESKYREISPNECYLAEQRRRFEENR